MARLSPRPPPIKISTTPSSSAKARSAPTSWVQGGPRPRTNQISVPGVLDRDRTPATKPVSQPQQLLAGDSKITTLQQWLDGNPSHPDRHLKIQDLLDRVAESGYTLPPYLLIKGVFIDGPDDVPVSGGNFADIFRGVYGQQAIAIKRFRAFGSHDDPEKVKLCKRFCREAIIWRQLRHPRILTFIGVDHNTFTSGTALRMVSPWIEQGTLLEYLSKVGDAPVDHKLLITDIASGLEYLHSQYFAHGDLHGSNVFIDSQNRALLARARDRPIAVTGDLRDGQVTVADVPSNP